MLVLRPRWRCGCLPVISTAPPFPSANGPLSSSAPAVSLEGTRPRNIWDGSRANPSVTDPAVYPLGCALGLHGMVLEMQRNRGLLAVVAAGAVPPSPAPRLVLQFVLLIALAGTGTLLLDMFGSPLDVAPGVLTLRLLLGAGR